MMERLSFLVFGFGSVFFLLRGLSREDFGTWALFLTMTAFIEVARNGLIQNAFIKFLSASQKEVHGGITAASFVLNCVLTVFSIILILSLSGLLSDLWKAPILKQMLYIYIATTILLIPFSQFNFIQQANFDFRGNFWANLTRQGLLFLYIVVCFASKSDLILINLVIFQVAAAAAGAFVSYWFAKKYAVFTWRFDWKWIIQLFHFGKFVFGTNLGSMLYKSIDKMMLGALMTTASVAVYDLAVRITNLIEVPTASMAAIVFPKSAKKAETEGTDAVKYLYERSVGIILALIIPGIVLVFIFADYVILLVAGEKYLDTASILRWTLLYGLFIPFSRQFGTVLDSVGKPKINFYFVILSAVLNVIFNYIFIVNYGVIGAVYGTLVTFAVRFVLNGIVLNKIFNINIFNAFIYMKVLYADMFRFALNFTKRKLHLGNSIS